MPSPAVSEKVAVNMQSASWIREMFEKGRKLKAEFGDEAVQDFSLGNPNAVQPEAFFKAVREVAAEHNPASHRYMPNAGFDETRAAVARFVSKEYRLEVEPSGVIMTSGAAGGMNVVLRSILNPGDEVIVLVPFFVEYKFYVEQAGGKVVFVETDDQCQPDIDAIEKAFSERTRAIIVNTPNNPSGAVYTSENCRALADLMKKHDSPERPVYLVTDDPYRRIIYDLDWCPTPATHYDRTIIISSYSKDVSIAGERAGYIALPSKLPERPLVCGAMTMLNRTLGYVNMSAFMQRVIARCADALCDVNVYRENRDLLCNALLEYGYELNVPGGALYAFPKTPIDDVEFVDALIKHRILTVPGRGFGRAGHIRISFCVDRLTIERALPGFKAAIEETR